MSKTLSQTAIYQLILSEFGESNSFTMEELWFRFHEKYVYSSRKELENIISDMIKQRKIEVTTNMFGKELFFLPKNTELPLATNPETNCQTKADSNDGCHPNRKALKEIKENELNLRHLKPQ